MDEVLIFDDFCPYKAFFEVRVDDSGCLRGLVSLVDGPGAAFIRSGREESLETEKPVGSLNQTGRAGFGQTHLVQEHLPVLVAVHLGDFRLRAG